MRGKNPASAAMPPVFGLPPAIQKMSEKQASALAAESALVALESLTNSTLPLRAMVSIRCARPGNERSPLWMASGVSPIASAAPAAQAAFWALWTPRSDPMPRRLASGPAPAPGGLDDLIALDIETLGERPQHRDAHHPLAGALDALGARAAPIVVDPDDRGTVALDAGDQPLLDGRIIAQRTMTVDVVLADIEQNSDRGIERRREVDLVGRHLDDVDAAGARRLERQDGGADIAAELHVVAGRAQQMGDQRGRGRLAVGAGDGDERGLPAWRRRSRQNSSMSPITSTPAARANPTVQCGAGCVSGTPGASTSAAILDQSTSARSAVANPARAAATVRSTSSSQASTCAPPAASARQLASPEPPSPKTATFLPAKVVTLIITAASASKAPPARAPPRRSRTGSRSAARSSRAARNDDGSAPSGTRACR